MHPCQMLLHIFRRKHIDVLDAHWLKDVFLEVVIQSHSGDALDKLSGPINIDTVFPLFARLVDKRLAKVIIRHA